jgi:ribonuclease G
MSQEILVNVTAQEVRVALLEGGILQEIHIERSLQQGLLGNIYKGRVGRLLPGIQAAFIDIGLDRSAFLHVSDMGGAGKLKNDFDEFSHLNICDLLSAGQEILVQVYKDPLGSKGARLTTQFTIPSRYLVFTPGVFQVAVSQKITDDVERERLMGLIQVSDQGGYIFRTAGEGATQAEIDSDKEFLDACWTEIEARSRHVRATEIVYEEIPIVLRVLRDLVGYDVEKIRVDNEEAVTKMRDFAKRYVPALVEKIEYHTGNRPIFDNYSVETELQKALERKVDLKSGGHVVFDQTEAMTTIDVNTGSYIGHSNVEQTIFKTNLEAIEVIARQVRLRNLGGIIIIDFIDMFEPSHKEHLLQSLKEALAKDSSKSQISELSSLGLVQMTRKRTRESLEHILCVPCPLCNKRGSVKSLRTICYEIFRELKRVSQSYSWPGFLVITSTAVANELLNEESTMLADLETQLGKPIKLRADASCILEHYDILPLSEKE